MCGAACGSVLHCSRTRPRRTSPHHTASHQTTHHNLTRCYPGVDVSPCFPAASGASSIASGATLFEPRPLPRLPPLTLLTPPRTLLTPPRKLLTQLRTPPAQQVPATCTPAACCFTTPTQQVPAACTPAACCFTTPAQQLQAALPDRTTSSKGMEVGADPQEEPPDCEKEPRGAN